MSFELAIPAQPAFAGFTLATQGAGIGGVGGLTLHNAIDLELGW